jgi:hypothetical protein
MFAFYVHNMILCFLWMELTLNNYAAAAAHCSIVTVNNIYSSKLPKMAAKSL